MKAPLEVIVPALADHETAESELPVPCTVALHCEFAPGATVVGVHEIATEETCEETGCDAVALYPPQAAHKSIPTEAMTSNTAERPGNSCLDGMVYIETEPATAVVAAS